jgi:hypothetical protein
VNSVIEISEQTSLLETLPEAAKPGLQTAITAGATALLYSAISASYYAIREKPGCESATDVLMYYVAPPIIGLASGFFSERWVSNSFRELDPKKKILWSISLAAAPTVVFHAIGLPLQHNMSKITELFADIFGIFTPASLWARQTCTPDKVDEESIPFANLKSSIVYEL